MAIRPLTDLQTAYLDSMDALRYGIGAQSVRVKQSREQPLPSNKFHFKTGEVARLTGVSARTLRRWEEWFCWKLQPKKAPSGHRVYSRSDLRSVLLIRDSLLKGRKVLLRIARDRRSDLKAG